MIIVVISNDSNDDNDNYNTIIIIISMIIHMSMYGAICCDAIKADASSFSNIGLSNSRFNNLHFTILLETN